MYRHHMQRAPSSWTAVLSATALVAQVSCGWDEPIKPPTPAAITPVSPTTFLGTAGLAVDTPPSVKVTSDDGKAVPGVIVVFVVASGGGYLTGTSVKTNAEGVATVTTWTLGSVAGPNTLAAWVGSIGPVTFTATGTAGRPTSLERLDGDAQSAAPGGVVAVRPSVRVADAYDNAVAGMTVTFSVASGGGSVVGATPTTNASGIAMLGSWTLGSTAGINTLIASANGLTPVTFTAASFVTILVVAPAIAAAAPNAAVAFTARNQVGAVQAVTWRVNGVTGGSAELGFISPGGQYSAPSTIPAGDSVVVSAVLSTDETRQSSSTVFFVPNLTARDYYVPIPRVVDATRPGPTRFLLVPPTAATSVTWLPVSGAAVPLTSIGNGVLTFVVDASTALSGYQNGTLHNAIGRLDYRDAAGGSVKLGNLGVNVRDVTMPDVAITTLATDAQRSPYVLNLRVDAVTIYATSAVVSRALQLLGGDRFDFVAVIATVTTNSGRRHEGLRNDARGIGAAVFDNSAPWGGTGRLRGALSFPIDWFFDGAEQGVLRGTGHSWINYATDPLLATGAPQWPPSTMALGTMGVSISGVSAGLQFPWLLTPIGNGMVRINRATPSDRFTPLDLYLMGLLPPDSVPPVYILPPSANPNTFVDGMTSPATTYTIGEYIASHGARVPASSAAQRAFATAVVVLTYGRLMTPSEMAFFDAAAARAETTVSLRSVSGLVTVDASGFFLATGGRATLRTRLP